VADLSIDRAKTALLCMDMHNIIVQRVPEGQRETLIPTVRRVLDGARNAGMQVIYVAVGRRREFMSPRNKFSGATGFVTDPAQLAEAMQFVDEIAPGDGKTPSRLRQGQGRDSDLATTTEVTAPTSCDTLRASASRRS
jgi:nicotinamidase-related amidase